MSRYGGGRRSGNDLAYGDDYYSGGGGSGGGGGGGGGGGQRWDRDRFERMRARSRGPPRERESFRYEEDDYYDRRGGERRDIKIDYEEDRRRGGRDNYDHYGYDDEKYEAPRRSKPDYLQDDRYRSSGREVAPYRAPEPRYERYERNAYDYDRPKKPQRPQYIRRQTSLDFDDRRRQPRYDEDDERDVNVNVSFRNPEPPRAPIPPRAPEPAYYDDFDDDYRDVRIRRERERDVYRRRRSSDSFEEIEVPQKKKKKAKRAKATFPKRKAHIRAIAEIGEPYEEDEFFYYVHYSSGVDKNGIDEVLRKSEIYIREEESSTSIKINESRMLEPPKPETYYAPPQDEGPEVIETTTTRIIENPSEDEIAKYERAAAAEKASTRKPRRASSNDSNLTRRTALMSVKSPSPSRKSRRGRDKSSRRSEVFESESNRGGDSGTLILPSRDKSRSRNEIEEDIRRLEMEKRSIREGRRIRDDSPREDEYEIVEPPPDRDIRVERNDRTGNLQFERDAPKRSKSSRRRRRPTQGDVNAALFTLT